MRQLFLSLLGILALYSCSQGSGPSEQPTRDEVTATFEMDLEAVYGGAPSAVADADGDLKALSFDTNQKSPIFIHKEGITSWRTHCFLRKADGSAQVYAEVDWDATTDEDGSIKLKMKGHTLTLYPSGGETLVTPQPGEEWYISGITGDGNLNSDRTKVDYRPDPSKDADLKPYQARVPLAFGWKKFKVAAPSGERAPKVTVVFKPQGSLLHLQVDNTTAINTGHFRVAGNIEVKTNALTTKGYFDYSLSPSTTEDAIATFAFDNPTAEDEVLSRSVSVGKNAKESYVLWGYPRPDSHLSGGASFKSKTTISPYRTYSDANKHQAGVERHKAYKKAIAYTSRVYVDRPILPIDYVTETNLAGGEGLTMTATNDRSLSGTKGRLRFADSNDNLAGGYYNWYVITGTRHETYNPDHKSLQNEVDQTFGADQYFIPDVDHWWGIFPSPLVAKSYTWVGRKVAEKQEEIFQLGDRQLLYGRGDYSASYTDTPDNENGDAVFYAIRFKGRSDGTKYTGTYIYDGQRIYEPIAGDALKCAYRITRVGGTKRWETEKSDVHTKVEVVYLGEEGDTPTSLGTISRPEWWNTQAPGKVLSCVFPANGTIFKTFQRLPFTVKDGHVVSLHSKSRGNETSIIYVNNKKGNVNVQDIWKESLGNGLGVRLFKKKP